MYDHAALKFTLGDENNEYEQAWIHVDFINYLVQGTLVGRSAEQCFLPIFVLEPSKNKDVE